MSRLELSNTIVKQAQTDSLYKELERRIAASPIRTCPVDMALGCLNLCIAQTCGKCVPCRIGLKQLSNLLDDVLNNRANMYTLNKIERLATGILKTADCLVGVGAAKLVLNSLHTYRADYEEHIKHHDCLATAEGPIPCMALCPARVDIPGYIALVAEGRYDDAVKLIRKDNPFPSACAYICEHPCEAHCRRNLLDDAVNIRGIKRVAVDNAGAIAAPVCADKTGKKIAVLGGGPAGLSAAYYLSLMGHDVTVFEMRNKLGGMLRYGIPEYRLPKAILDKEIEYILSAGITVKTGVKVGSDVFLRDIETQYDSVFVTIGAHKDKKLDIPGEQLNGVISAVELLARMGSGERPDFAGKKVVVVGGGNVAMDVTRTAIRLGAEKVTCVYRRRLEDMTALPEEVRAAQGEGATLLALHAPVRIEGDENGNVRGLIAVPQVIGQYDKAGRPAPRNANAEERICPADVIVVAIGQDIESQPFEENIPLTRGRIQAGMDCRIKGHDNVFAGGDCVTGPATVIRAIAAGKTAAANIDQYLGFDHKISVDVDIPGPVISDKPQCGRINIRELEACDAKDNFQCVECGIDKDEAMQEASRCLRCDYFGCGNFRGGRQEQW